MTIQDFVKIGRSQYGSAVRDGMATWVGVGHRTGTTATSRVCAA